MRTIMGGSPWWRDELGARREEDALGIRGWRFREIFEKAAVGVALEDAEGRVIESNPAFREMLGYGEEELREVPHSRFTHPEDEAEDAKLREELFRGEREGFRIEKRYIRKDGSFVWGHLNASLLTDADENPAFAVCVVEDIAQRKQAEEELKGSEEELKESEERYRAVVEQSAEGIFLQDAGSKRLLETNPALQEMLGYTAGELRGMEAYDLLSHPPEEVDREARLEEGRRFLGEWKLLRKDGSTLDAEVSVGVISYGGERVICTVVRDIGERKKVQKDLREAGERFRVAFEEAPIGVSLVDLDNLFVKVNPALRALLGYSEEELVGHASAEFTHPGDVQASRDYMRRVLENGDRTYELEKRYLRADGRRVWVSLNVALVRDPDGNPSHYVCHHQDITERKKAEEALRLSEGRMRAVIEQSPMSIHIFTPDGVSLRSNASWNELWGLKEGETPEGTNVFEDEQLAESGLLEYVKESLDGVRMVTPPLLYDPARTEREGSARWLEAYIYPVEDGNGRLREMVLVIEDVTRREEAREELERSEERFRAMAHNASDLVLVHGPDGRLSYASPSTERILGYEPEEIVGRDPFDYIHSEDAEQVRAVLRDLPEGGTSRTVVYRFRHKDGSWRCLESTGSNPGAGSGVEGVVVNSRDITEREEVRKELERSEEWFRAMVRNSSDVITILDTDGTVRYQSPAIERVLGHGTEELVGEIALEQIHPEDAGRVSDVFERLSKEGGTHLMMEYRFRHKDGSWRYLESIGSKPGSESGVQGFVINSRDVTERVWAEGEIKLKNRAIDASSNGILICDMTQEDQPTVYSNRAMADITGYAPEEILGRNPRFLQGVDVDQVEARRLSAAVEAEQEWFGTIRNYKKDGTLFYNEMYVAPVRDGGGRITHYVGVQNDVTERRAMEEQLAYQAFHDSLTGLPNRALFRDRLEQALSRADRHGNAVAVLYMDLDNFKYVNDSLGHEAGDELLIGVAERLRWGVRPGDTAARLGGDEFAVLLEEVKDAEDAAKVAERVSEELREPLTIRGQEVFAGASIGVAASARGGGRVEDLLRDADAAMYAAKQEGKNRYKVFEAGMSVRSSERLGVENALRRAMGRGEFRLHYQPKVLLRGGRTVGVEALLRWERPGRGLVLPAGFISIAEETGLIVPMGHWVLREACRQAKAWRERYAEAPAVWVNLSARQLHQADLAGEISGVLDEVGLPPEGLGLEITESVLVEYGGTAVSTLDELKALGIKLAIDDFGTGYSSLSYLKRLPVDVLKIDRSFVAGIDKSTEDEVLVSAVINLAQALNLEVVAEGVETVDQLRKLHSLGCDLAQGYLFSHPLPPEEATPFLEEDW